MNRKMSIFSMALSVFLVACGPKTPSTKQVEPQTTKTTQTTTRTTAHTSTSQTPVVTTQETTVEPTTQETTATTQVVAETSQMNLEAIQQGDFSSIAGKWKNGEGREVEIDSEGKINQREFINLSYYSMKNGAMQVGVNAIVEGTGTGYGLLLIPKGNVQPDMTIDGKTVHDASDSTQDRLYMGHQFSVGNGPGYFYRVLD